MKQHIIRLFLIVSLVWLAGGVCRSVCAEEPALRFVDALREAGYFDTALEYLESIKDSPLVPLAEKATLDYQRGLTLAKLAEVERNPDRQDELLKQAEAAFKYFMDQQPSHPLVPAARRQLGNLLVLRARTRRSLSERNNDPSLLKQAVADLDAAHKVYQASIDDIVPQLESLKAIPPGETQLLDLRKNLRDELLQTQVVSAGAIEEKADLLANDPAQAKQLYAQAAGEFEKIYQKYRVRIGGLYARMYQARCLKKQGELDKAVAILDADILSQSDSKDTFRELRTRALLLAIETWLDPSQAKYAEAVRRATEWLGQQRPNEKGQPEWLQLQLLAAKAMKGYAEKLKEKNPKDPQIKEMYSSAKELARDVLRYPGPLKNEAREFLTYLPGGLNVAEAEKLPDNYADAEALAKEVVAIMDETRQQVEQAKAELAAAAPAKKAELEKKLKEQQKQLAEQLQRVEEVTRHALKLGGAELEPEKRASLLYYIAFSKLVAEHYHDAFVIASFVAEHYADTTSARPCGQTAIQAAALLYDQAAPDDRDFERELLARTCRYVIDTWSDEPEGEFAMGVLVPLEIQDGHVDKAEELAQKIKPSSSQWSVARLRIGQAYWGEAIRVKQQLRAAEDADRPALEKELQALRKKAISYLEQGLSQLKTLDDYEKLTAMGALYLVQAYLDERQVDQALVWLEDPKKGLLALIAAGKTGSLPAAFALETYQLSLRALVQRIAMGSGAGQQDELIGRLKSVMAQLDQYSGNDEQGRKQTLAVYFVLTKELADEIASRSNPQEKAALAQGAQLLLAAVSGQSSDVNTLRWAADTMRTLAQSLTTSSTTAAEAKAFFQQAARTYQKVLELAAQSPASLSPDAKHAVQYWLAISLQAIGDLPQSIEVLRDLLTEKETMLTAQVAAAEAFEKWGDRDKRPELYRKALVGAYPSGQKKTNVIWGWIKLGRITARYPKFRSVFYQSQFHRARCQYRLAMSEQNSTERKQDLSVAKTAIVQTYRLYPDLGGNEWRSKFDGLLKQVQKALGESPTGLRGLSSGKRRKS